MPKSTMLTSEEADLLSETHYLVEAISILTERPLLEPSAALAVRINDVVNCLSSIAFRRLNDFHRGNLPVVNGGSHG